jgi:hypothetical protein
MSACPACVEDPRHPDPLVEAATGGPFSQTVDPAHNLVSKDDGKGRGWGPALDLVQLCVTHA